VFIGRAIGISKEFGTISLNNFRTQNQRQLYTESFNARPLKQCGNIYEDIFSAYGVRTR
jgi:hypothetical protein